MILDSLLSIVYPLHCFKCSTVVDRRSDRPACSSCWDETRIFHGNETLCAKCSAIQSFERRSPETRCRACDDHFYDRATAVGVYEGALAASVVSLKTVPVVGSRLSGLLAAAFLRSGFFQTDLIVPVPLSAKRRLERGFNQSEEIASALSAAVGVDVDRKSLRRRLDTPFHRAGMDRKAREATVERAFEVCRPKLVDGRRILLVDDVFTTGATASNCAKTLKAAGAVSVNVLTIARAGRRE
jgi:ComF family protein